MRSSDFIYRIFRHTPQASGLRYHKLIIEVAAKESYDETLTFEWQANDEPEGNYWYACRMEYKTSNFKLIPFVNKVANDKTIRWGCTPQECVAFLNKHGIEAGTWIEVDADNGKFFSGLVGLSEITKGTFMRYNGKKFSISNRETQIHHISQLAEAEKFEIPKTEMYEK